MADDLTRWRRIQDLFHAARSIEADERAAFLRDRAADDPELADEVLGLLDEHFSDAEVESLGGMGPSTEDLTGLALGQYELVSIVGRGAMGVVYEARQESVGRSVALKILRPREEVLLAGATPEHYERMVERFAEEAETLGLLDHPGIVPIHEMARADDGRRYFTMRLVQGRDLQQIIRLVHDGADGWTQQAALRVVLKVCETMAFAHDRGVLHRDLKPSHVMVGRFGQVYIVDWGLARVRGRRETRDIRLRQSGEARESRSAESTELRTIDGDVVGTPAYMPPEQAQGRLERIGEHSDVYAVGAILYHLLTGRVPYSRPGESRPSARETLERVVDGPPPPIHAFAPGLPAELIAICDKAMASSIDARYPSMNALSDDLSAFLDNRVVKAYEVGPVAELRKWFARNRALAGTVLFALLVILVGTTGSSILLANKNEALTEARNLALEGETRAEQQAQSLMQLADLHRLERLRREANILWPAHPEKLAQYDDWLARAREVVSHLDEHRRKRDELARFGRRIGDADVAADAPLTLDTYGLFEIRARIEGSEGLLGLMERAEEEQGEWRGRLPSGRPKLRRLRTLQAFIELAGQDFLESAEQQRQTLASWSAVVFDDDDERQWWYVTLERLIADIEDLSSEGGLLALVENRRAFAATVEEMSVTSPEAAALWESARTSIASVEECPAYGGLEIEPQLGLLPLRRDPRSGLWEFAHLATGLPPELEPETDAWRIVPETGLVLVLLPGGTFRMGAQDRDEDAPNYTDGPIPDEATPVHEVTLAPFFVSKYEMTQAQWRRCAGENPSGYHPGVYDQEPFYVGLTNPVDSVKYEAAYQLMRNLDLALPTEAQWEYAARAGTDWPWWTGPERDSLEGHANLADQSARRTQAAGYDFSQWPELDDGWPVHAPVDALTPNPFGLHAIHGNVGEWCRDLYGDYLLPQRESDGFRLAHTSFSQVYRGGNMTWGPLEARVFHRHWTQRGATNQRIGVRPSRELDVAD